MANQNLYNDGATLYFEGFEIQDKPDISECHCLYDDDQFPTTTDWGVPAGVPDIPTGGGDEIFHNGNGFNGKGKIAGVGNDQTLKCYRYKVPTSAPTNVPTNAPTNEPTSPVRYDSKSLFFIFGIQNNNSSLTLS